MKKSTLIFILGNLMVLVIPLLFMLSLRFKINRGDVIDIVAEYEAQYKKQTIPVIDTLELNSEKRGLVNIEIFMDTLNQIIIDTGDYKYLTYQLIGKKLVVNYNFRKDSTENPDICKEIIDYPTGDEEMVNYNNKRELRLFVTVGLKRIKINGGDVILNLSDDIRQENNIDIEATNGYFIFSKNRIDYNYSEDMDSIDLTKKGTYIPYKVKATLNNAELRSELDYIKELEIEAVNSTINIDGLNFDKYNLRIDENSTTNVEISKLKKMKIEYLK